MKRIVIFTPTYNRGYTLHKLYESLKKQTCHDFIWLIVDDGSTDDTQNLIKKWIRDKEIEIQYHKQENQGKSMAHNKGVELTKTELFTCVDSDDYLNEKAVEDILKRWDKQCQYKKIVGIVAYKANHKGQSLTILVNKDIESFKLKDGYRKYGLRGDTMLVFKTGIISKYKFPKYEGEMFVPEAYIYDQIDKDGELLVLREVLYYSEYLDDGYTKNMAKLLLKNPKGYLAFIKQRLVFNSDLKHNILDTIRYTAMCMSSKEKKYIRNSVYPIITIITIPLAYVFYCGRYKRN